MSVEIQQSIICKRIVKRCVGDSGVCMWDKLPVCECNIFSGNPNLPNKYAGK